MIIDMAHFMQVNVTFVKKEFAYITPINITCSIIRTVMYSERNSGTAATWAIMCERWFIPTLVKATMTHAAECCLVFTRCLSRWKRRVSVRLQPW